MSSFKLASIEEAIQDFKKGQFVIVVDDEDRENEGDLIMAAEFYVAQWPWCVVCACYHRALQPTGA